MDHNYLGSSSATDYAQGAPIDSSPLSHSLQQGQNSRFNEDFDASQRGSSIIDGDGMRRSDSVMSNSQTLTPSRGGTLKKKHSLKKSGSLRRSSSRRSVGAGSVKSLALGDHDKYEGSDVYSAFFTPVPTKGSPTEILTNRFQDWRKVLKDLIAYFREVQKSHEARSKSLLSLSNLASNLTPPPGFMSEGGIGDATKILKQYHKQALQESNKAKGIEDDIMAQLTGLRSDLQQKIKEIKNLSGDFKNSVDKETEGTRKAVRGLQEALEQVDHDASATAGKGDPYIVRLGVDRQIERQIDEENYLHKAFLNLEHSGRELESIVVGEIQKAYNAYAGILKREADEAYETVENLRTGPVMLQKDHEWDSFVSNNDHFVDPRMPIRKPEQIHYPGREASAASEVRAGMLERKSKYLKSYTPGWYVLSPTHLHEFKSADRLSSQQPVMSLFLNEQKLGNHSGADSSSHKFMLKGRQAGGMHRGHGWTFRAESHDTMLAWFDDIKNLTEKTGFERDAFVRRHARSVSGGSYTAGSVSSDGAIEEDEADQVPYSATPSQFEETAPQEKAPRPQPGGRFPSDLNVNRHLQMPLSPSSGTSSDDRDAIAAAGAIPGTVNPYEGHRQSIPEDRALKDDNYNHDQETRGHPTYGESHYSSHQPLAYNAETSFTQPREAPPVPQLQHQSHSSDVPPVSQVQRQPQTTELPQRQDNHDAVLGATVPGVAAGAAGAAAYQATKQHAPHETTSASAAGTQTQHFSSSRETYQQQPVIPDSTTVATPLAVGAAAPLVAGDIKDITAPQNLTTNLNAAPGTPATTATTMSALSDSTVEDQPLDIKRPGFAAMKSVNTISDLHIPGEFPKPSLHSPPASGA